MKRLTKRYVDGQAWVSMNHVAASGEYECVGPAIDRLAAYEDTGLEPEEIVALKTAMIGKAIAEIKEFDRVPIDHLRELVQAEKDGRLVVLPCKAGDRVYMPFLGRILEREVISVVLNGGVTTIYYSGTSACSSPDDFGETVFLTREEAEAALEREKGNKNG